MLMLNVAFAIDCIAALVVAYVESPIYNTPVLGSQLDVAAFGTTYQRG
jgi:hypothetical protein